MAKTKKMVPQSKKFGGKTFKLGGAVKSKSSAEKYKKRNREKGKLTRVQKIGPGNYVIWERG